MNFTTMRMNDLKKIVFDSNHLLVDLRSSQDYVIGHLPLAINLPFEQWKESPESLFPYRSKTLYLYCEYGNISLLAARLLTESGFHVINLYGGIQSYRGPKVRSY